MKAFLFLIFFSFSTPALSLPIEKLTDQELNDFSQGINAFLQKKYRKALVKLQPAGKRGYPEAQLYIGWMHLMGLTGEIDVCKGVDWIDKSAQNKNPLAQLVLSHILSDVYWGYQPDYKRAYGWALTAIENGLTDVKHVSFLPNLNIRNHLTTLEDKLNEAEKLEARRKVADKHFDFKAPASTYLIRYKTLYVKDSQKTITVLPCKPISPEPKTLMLQAG